MYEITPPKTNDMFETYYGRIDPDYGVYWLKAIGKDIYTNGYGDRVKSEFENLVASIRRTYGEELYRVDEVKESSIWGDPERFMYALERGDRTLEAVWSKFDENSGFSKDRQALYVMTESSESEAAVKHYVLGKVTFEDGLFIHTGRTFFTKEGAEKQLTLTQGREWTGGDSIDDYC